MSMIKKGIVKMTMMTNDIIKKNKKKKPDQTEIIVVGSMTKSINIQIKQIEKNRLIKPSTLEVSFIVFPHESLFFYYTPKVEKKISMF